MYIAAVVIPSALGDEVMQVRCQRIAIHHAPQIATSVTSQAAKTFDIRCI